MKTSRHIRFAVQAALFSAGCIALLTHAFFVIGAFCACISLSGIVLDRHPEISRPVDLLGMLAVLPICVAVMILARLLWAGERLVGHSAFVVTLWVGGMFGIFWQWRRERRSSDAQQVAGANRH